MTADGAMYDPIYGPRRTTPTREGEPRARTPEPRAGRGRDAGRRGLIITAVVVILALSAFVRFYALGKPSGIIVDEVFYAKDAKAIIDGKLAGTTPGYMWMPGNETSWSHPEYGKLAIALGILAFGYDSFGWRFMPAVAGLLLLALVYPLARRFGLSREWALAALILAAADMLGIAQSRIAMLDIFVGLWTVACVYCALRYVQDGHRWPWLLLTGLAGGLAAGTKWSGALALLAAGTIMVLFRERHPHQSDMPRGAQALRVARDALLPVAALVLLPVALYVASYAFYFAAGHPWSDWWEMQKQAWHFNVHLHAKHSAASAAPMWILDIVPWWSYFKRTDMVHAIVAMGNPALWWAAALALVALPAAAIHDRDRRLALPALIVAILYFPWFATSRTSFIYYMTPVAPFMAILVAAGLSRLAREPLRLPRRRPSDDVYAEETDYGPPWLPLAAFAAAGLVTALFWYRIGHFLARLFWRLPATHISVGFAYVVTAVAVAAGAALLAWLVFSLRSRVVWRALAWAYVGLVAGICIVFLKIVVDIAIPPEQFYRLIWLPSWL